MSELVSFSGTELPFASEARVEDSAGTKLMLSFEAGFEAFSLDADFAVIVCWTERQMRRVW
jgi:hypothetical protein